MESGKSKRVAEEKGEEKSKRVKTNNGFDSVEICLLDENPLYTSASASSLTSASASASVSASASASASSMAENDSKLSSKGELRERLVELGASVTDSPTSKTYAIVTFRPQSVSAKHYREAQTHSLVHARWLIKCVKEKKLRPPGPMDCIFAHEKTKATWAGIFDPLGDPYDEDIDLEGMKRILAKMEREKREEDRQSSEGDENSSRTNTAKYTPRFLFYEKNVYCDTMEKIGDTSTEEKSSSLEITGLDIKAHYGSLSKTLDSTVTHVICETKERALVFEMEKLKNDWDYYVVSPEWVDKSMEEGRLLEEDRFSPV